MNSTFQTRRTHFPFVTALLLFTQTLALRPATASGSIDFNAPFGVAVNSQDVIYVAEIGGKRIRKLSTDGDFIGEIKNIDGYGPLSGPFDVAIGPDNRIAIADTLNHRIVVLDANEKLQFSLGGEKSASPGSFSQPHFVTFNRKGEIFVSDTFNARIQKFSAKGELIKTWGKVGSGPGEFLMHGYLADIDASDDGFIYVREFDGGRIQKFTEDGQHLGTFSSRGTAEGELDEGYGLAIIDGDLYCPDTFESRMQIFSRDGQLKKVWDPGEGDSGLQFNHPVGIAATSNGDLILTNWKSNRILKLNKTGKLLAEWGRPMSEEMQRWKPPMVVNRPGRGPIRFGMYGGVDEASLTHAREAGLSIIYPSIGNQYRDWNLAATSAKAASFGVEIHPSIACLPFGQGAENSDVFEKHPEWCIWKKDSAEPMKTLLSWSSEGARSFRADHIVDQVKASGVSGVMLDYIRYLGTDYGYDPIVVEGFRNEFGIDPGELPQDDPRWMQYRADFVTKFIAELRHKLAVKIPDRHIEISVYLSGDDPAPDAYLKQSLQDWRTWARMGIIDTLHVAWYTRNLDDIYNAVRRVRDAVPDRVKVNSFIACYGGNLNTPEMLAKGIEASVSAGADEVTIYRGDTIDELNLWPAIRNSIQQVNSEMAAGR